MFSLAFHFRHSSSKIVVNHKWTELAGNLTLKPVKFYMEDVVINKLTVYIVTSAWFVTQDQTCNIHNYFSKFKSNDPKPCEMTHLYVCSSSRTVGETELSGVSTKMGSNHSTEKPYFAKNKRLPQLQTKEWYCPWWKLRAVCSHRYVCAVSAEEQTRPPAERCVCKGTKCPRCSVG